MKHLKWVLVGLLVGFTATAETAKIGYVDFHLCLTSVPAGKKAKEQLEKDITAKNTSLQKEQEAWRKEAQEFEKKAGLMNETARAARSQELQKKLLEIQQKMQSSQADLQKRERELTEPILTRLRSIVEALGKEKKFDLILEKNEGAVLYAQAGADLTQEVIGRYK